MSGTEINGKSVTNDDLAAMATINNYGHFTSMQVRHGRVRGLALHLHRLEEATRELFGRELPGDRVRAYLRHVVDEPDLSVRVTVFSRDLAAVRAGEAVEPQVLVSTGPPFRQPVTRVRVRSVGYQRDLPHLKHVGTFGLFHHRRQAVLDGYDDALLTDSAGVIAEATLANVGFFDGDTVVWPQAPALPGITLQLLKKGLHDRGIPTDTRPIRLTDLGLFRGGFLTSTTATARPLASVNNVTMETDARLITTLMDCYESHPWDPL